MESPTIKPLLSKSDIETAAIQIQSMFRGYHVRSRLMLLQQATECASVGVMLAFRGTKQVSILLRNFNVGICILSTARTAYVIIFVHL